MSRTKSWRRAQNSRILERLKRLEKANEWRNTPEPFKNWSIWTDNKGNIRYLDSYEDIFELRQLRAKRRLDTKTPCSCWMCGNPRKYEKQATLQERRFVLACKYID